MLVFMEDNLKVVIQATCLGTDHLCKESVLVPHSYQFVLQLHNDLVLLIRVSAFFEACCKMHFKVIRQPL